MDAYYDISAAYPARRWRLHRLFERLRKGQRKSSSNSAKNRINPTPSSLFFPEIHGELTESELISMSVFWISM
jgi:hypothetical protein